MKKRALLALASLGILVTVLIYGTIAWYTTISNVTGLTMDAAKFDFKVNDQGEAFLLDVFQYQNVLRPDNRGLAAPGTGGVIPIEVTTTEQSEVGATYAINIDFSRIAPEFKERLRFYYFDKSNKKHYLTGDSNSDLIGTLAAKETVTEYVYWEWLYTADVSAILEAPVGGSWTSYKYLDEMSNGDILDAVDAWKTAGTSSAQYAEMTARGAFTHLDPANFGTFFSGCKSGEQMRERIESADWFEAHDAFDTQIGFGELDQEFPSDNGITYKAGTMKLADGTEMQVLAYQQAMMVDLLVSGAQAVPVYGIPETAISKGTSQYIKLDKTSNP